MLVVSGAGRLFITLTLSIIIITSSITIAQEELSISRWELPHTRGIPLTFQATGYPSEENVTRRVLLMGIERGYLCEVQGCLRIEWTHEGEEMVNPGTMTALFFKGDCYRFADNWVKAKGWPSAPVRGEKGRWGWTSPWLSVSAVKTKETMTKKKTKEKNELKVSQLFRPMQTLRFPLPFPPSAVTFQHMENLREIQISKKIKDEGHCSPITLGNVSPTTIIMQETDSVLVRLKKRPGKEKGKQAQKKEEEKNNELKSNKREMEEKLKETGKEEKVKKDIKEQKENQTKVGVRAKMLGDYGFCNGSDESNLTSVVLDVDELAAFKVEYNQGKNASLYISNSLISLDAHNHTMDDLPNNQDRDLNDQRVRWQKGDYMNNSFCYNPWFIVDVEAPDDSETQTEIFFCDSIKPKVSLLEPSFNQTTGNKTQEKDGKEEIEKGKDNEKEVKDEEDKEEEEEVEEEDNTFFYKLLLVMHSIVFACFVDTAILISSCVMEAWRMRDQWREELTLERAKPIILFVLTFMEIVMGVVAIGITIALINGL